MLDHHLVGWGRAAAILLIRYSEEKEKRERDEGDHSPGIGVLSLDSSHASSSFTSSTSLLFSFYVTQRSSSSSCLI
jgi:hypothetical protein